MALIYHLRLTISKAGLCRYPALSIVARRQLSYLTPTLKQEEDLYE